MKPDYGITCLNGFLVPADILSSVVSLAKSWRAFPGCEVAVSDAPSGQLIVVVEAEDSETLIQTIESVRNVEGVLAVSLVYHQQ